MNLDSQTALRREILLSIDSETIDKLNEEALCTQINQHYLLQSDNAIYINQLWQELLESDMSSLFRDYISDFRDSGTPTGLSRPNGHRYFESTEVARKITGRELWIGWTYWHGGGKYDEPEKMPWIENAYYLNAKTELREVLVFQPIN